MVATVAAAGSEPTPAAAAPEPVKCVDCYGEACHVVYGPGAMSCELTEFGCVPVGDCG
jgi:hypothetical protein